MFADAQVHKSGNSLHVTHGDDSGLYVEFYMRAIEIPIESEKAGRPIFQDVPYIRINFPGDRTKAIDRPIIDDDKHRFEKRWKAFEGQQTQSQVGTPLEEWAILTKSEVMELKAVNIHTVDQLAAVPDNALTWLGSHSTREKARAFLAQAKDGSELSRLVSENETMKTDLQALKDQIMELSKSKKGVK